MKRTLAVFLVLMMLCVSALAMAEAPAEVTIEITFDGEWVSFEAYGFQLFLPTEWVEYEPEESLFVFGSEDGGQLLDMSAIELDEGDIESLLAELTETEGFSEVGAVTINGIPFVCYVIEEQDVFGAVTITTTGMGFDFMFYPNSDSEFVGLAMQIMASISPVE